MFSDNSWEIRFVDIPVFRSNAGKCKCRLIFKVCFIFTWTNSFCYIPALIFSLCVCVSALCGTGWTPCGVWKHYSSDEVRARETVITESIKLSFSSAARFLSLSLLSCPSHQSPPPTRSHFRNSLLTKWHTVDILCYLGDVKIYWNLFFLISVIINMLSGLHIITLC